jgi:hypothetical protein
MIPSLDTFKEAFMRPRVGAYRLPRSDIHAHRTTGGHSQTLDAVIMHTIMQRLRAHDLSCSAVERQKSSLPCNRRREPRSTSSLKPGRHGYSLANPRCSHREVFRHRGSVLLAQEPGSDLTLKMTNSHV